MVGDYFIAVESHALASISHLLHINHFTRKKAARGLRGLTKLPPLPSPQSSAMIELELAVKSCCSFTSLGNQAKVHNNFSSSR
jgi:hypothetical protein